MGLRGFGPRLIANKGHGRVFGGGDGVFGVCASVGDVSEGEEFLGQFGGFSHESEHDLEVMVSDFLENGSSGADTWCSSDSDSGHSDLGHLADKISIYNCNIDRCEKDLLALVQTFLLSTRELNLHPVRDGPCSGSCIRQSLVKFLRLSGYDAALCISKWQGFDKVPGGDHEYIDVIVGDRIGGSRRLIIDLDFRSHFEIARAVESYDAVLKKLPVVYVGSSTRLKQMLHVMVEATKISLKKNSMPLPPWRSLSYLEAKWHSTYERIVGLHGRNRQNTSSLCHKQCVGHLRRLKSSIHLETERERLLKPIILDNGRRAMPERLRSSPLII